MIAELSPRSGQHRTIFFKQERKDTTVAVLGSGQPRELPAIVIAECDKLTQPGPGRGKSRKDAAHQ